MNRNRGLISIHIAVLLFGTAGLFGKFLNLSPVMIVFGRVAFASFFLGLTLLFRRSIFNTGRKSVATKNGSFLLPVLLGPLLAVHWITFFHSIQLSTVAIGLLSFSTFPIFVVFLEPLFLKTPFKFVYLVFALITLFGVWLLVPEFRWENVYFQGIVWGCISGLLFAFLTIINKYLTSSNNPVSLAYIQNGIACIILLPFAAIRGIMVVTPSEWLILILLGVVFTAISHTTFISGLKTVKARVAGIIACMEPVYGTLFAFILLSERPDMRTIIGGLIILGSAIYLTIRKDGSSI